MVILSLVLPGLLLFFFAILAPICLSVYYGFTDYSGMGQAHFIGWQNYKKLIVDEISGCPCEIPYCWPSAYLYPASACHDYSSSVR